MVDESLDDAWAAALQEQKDTESGGEDDWASAMDGQNGKKKASQPVHFEELGDGAVSTGGSQNLDFLLDIPLTVSVELGRSRMIINSLLHLTQGSVIELEKAAGETVEIYVNDKLLGKGEVIVVNERFGVRITEIISQADRIKSMA